MKRETKQELPLHIVDVFAEEKYAGNQLAVVRNAGRKLSNDKMQRIAREMHFSETTFILSDKPRNGGYDVRIFTPGGEVPFAGHPTLGTAYVIRSELLKGKVDRIMLNLKVGQIPVTFARGVSGGEIVWMRQKEPDFGGGGELTDSDLSKVLSINAEDIDNRFPIQDVSTGLPTIIVPLKTLDALKRARLDVNKYFELVRNTRAKLILIFSPETYERGHDLSVRVFAEYDGVPEDPATGSSNGCLAAYLVKHRYFGEAEKIDLKVEQGYNLGRPSRLYLKSQLKGDGIEVNVGGRVVPVAQGELL